MANGKFWQTSIQREVPITAAEWWHQGIQNLLIRVDVYGSMKNDMSLQLSSSTSILIAPFAYGLSTSSGTKIRELVKSTSGSQLYLVPSPFQHPLGPPAVLSSSVCVPGSTVYQPLLVLKIL